MPGYGLGELRTYVCTCVRRTYIMPRYGPGYLRTYVFKFIIYNAYVRTCVCSDLASLEADAADLADFVLRTYVFIL
jgi:hypothetical protein